MLSAPNLVRILRLPPTVTCRATQRPNESKRPGTRPGAGASSRSSIARDGAWKPSRCRAVAADASLHSFRLALRKLRAYRLQASPSPQSAPTSPMFTPKRTIKLFASPTSAPTSARSSTSMSPAPPRWRILGAGVQLRANAERMQSGASLRTATFDSVCRREKVDRRVGDHVLRGTAGWRVDRSRAGNSERCGLSSRLSVRFFPLADPRFPLPVLARQHIHATGGCTAHVSATSRTSSRNAPSTGLRFSTRHAMSIRVSASGRGSAL